MSEIRMKINLDNSAVQIFSQFEIVLCSMNFLQSNNKVNSSYIKNIVIVT